MDAKGKYHRKVKAHPIQNETTRNQKENASWLLNEQQGWAFFENDPRFRSAPLRRRNWPIFRFCSIPLRSASRIGDRLKSTKFRFITLHSASVRFIPLRFAERIRFVPLHFRFIQKKPKMSIFQAKNDQNRPF